MTKSELSQVQQAAERLQLHEAIQGPDPDQDYCASPYFIHAGFGRFDNDRRALDICAVKSWSLPFLDSTPITEGWLKSIGFKPWKHWETDTNPYELYIPMSDELGSPCRLAYQTNGFYAVRMIEDNSNVAESVELLGTRNMNPAVTCGRVRLLLASFGIEVKA